MIGMLGMIFLLAGLVSGVARMLLFNALKKTYPTQYIEIGSPSVFFQNLNPVIPLETIRDGIEEADYKRFLDLRRLIYIGNCRAGRSQLRLSGRGIRARCRPLSIRAGG